MRPALAALFLAGSLSAAPAQFSITVPQPLRVLTPFTVTVAHLSNNPRPQGSATFTLDGEPYTPGTSLGGGFSFICQSAGTHQIGYHFAGDANYDPVDTFVTFEVLPKIATFVTAPTTDPPSPSAGQPFIISTVATSEEGAPTGFIAFYNGATLIATGAAGPDRTFSATIVLPLGTHSLTARYNTTGIYEESVSPPLVLTLARSATILDRPAVSGTPRFGQPLTISAAISPAATGPVTFFDGAAELGAALLTNGTASITTSSLTIGVHDITARYAGNADFAPSTSPILKQTIKGLPTVELTSTPNPSPGALVNFTAKLISPSPQAPAPTGPITLRNGTELLGQTPITLSLPAGEHTITATYSGDANYEPAIAILTQRVTGAAPSHTAIDLLIGDTAALNIRVTSDSAPPPTGTVRIGETTLPVANGTATLADARAFLGRRVTAEYSGDAIHAASTAGNHLVLAPLNGFSFTFGPLAPDQIVTVFGDSLDGATARIGDRAASTYFASAKQATFALPDAIPDGTVPVTITNEAGQAFAALATIARTAPGIATASADGTGPPAAQLLRLRAGSQRTELLSGPIVFNGDDIYLILYGTGFRHATSPVTCTAAGRTMTAAYAGPQGDYPGLDQINLPLDVALTHAGASTLTCTADGRTSNAVSLVFP